MPWTRANAVAATAVAVRHHHHLRPGQPRAVGSSPALFAAVLRNRLPCAFVSAGNRVLCDRAAIVAVAVIQSLRNVLPVLTGRVGGIEQIVGTQAGLQGIEASMVEEG